MDDDYGAEHDAAQPGWTFERFGITRTRLPDGRVVCIGGEHENGHDPDFYIYNDVIVILPDGTLEIYMYPIDVFPPTDFHTATLIGESIFVIGSIGYKGARGGPTTPVYKLDTRTLRIERLETTGDASPGWISNHRAAVVHDEIVVEGGNVIVDGQTGEKPAAPNTRAFVLNPTSLRWRFAEMGESTEPAALPQTRFIGAFDTPADAQYQRDGVCRGVGPGHALFCHDDFRPLGMMVDGSRRHVHAMTDGRFAVSAGPSWVGRSEGSDLEVTFFSDWASLIASLAAAGVQAN